MTRKDYEAIAGAFREAIAMVDSLHGGDSGSEVHAIDVAAREIAKVLAADNGRFDRDRFLTAVRG